MTKRSQEGGFSLAETLIAVTIFVIVVVPFAYLFVSSTRAAGQSQHLTVAYNAAQKQVQMLRSVPFAALSTASNSYNGGTNFYLNPVTVDGQTVFRTTIPAAMLPTARELPSASGTIDLRTVPMTNTNSGRTINCATATVTISWSTGGHAPMSVNLKTLLAPGGMNDF